MAQKEKEKSNFVAVKDLPVYAEPPRITDYRFVEDAPVFGETFVRKLRCSQFMNSIKGRLGIVNQSLEPVKEAATATEDYIRAEQDLFPKAAAITLGGLAGFVMGMRSRGRMRRWIYATGGLLTMSAFCYPHETMQIIRTGIVHAQRTWEDFQKSPDPGKKSS